MRIILGSVFVILSLSKDEFKRIIFGAVTIATIDLMLRRTLVRFVSHIIIVQVNSDYEPVFKSKS